MTLAAFLEYVLLEAVAGVTFWCFIIPRLCTVFVSPLRPRLRGNFFGVRARNKGVDFVFFRARACPSSLDGFVGRFCGTVSWDGFVVALLKRNPCSRRRRRFWVRPPVACTVAYFSCSAEQQRHEAVRHLGAREQPHRGGGGDVHHP